MRYVLFLFAVCLASVSDGQMLANASVTTPHPAVVRVVVPESDGTAYGSGTLIDLRDDYGLVLTNWHVVRDATGPIEVSFPSGFVSQARSIKMDSDWDLAALVIWRPPCEPVRLAARPPRPGDRLTICGYGAGNYRQVTGRCTQFYAPRLELPQELVELDVQARQGDSGGPIFNHRGELAGVLFGAGQGTTLGSFEGRVKTFLASLAPDIGQRDSAPQVASRQPVPNCPSCQPGVVCENGSSCTAGDLGDVCFGCDSVAEHNRVRRPIAPSSRTAPTDSWPKADEVPRPSLHWSAGEPTGEPPSEPWPRFEGDAPASVPSSGGQPTSSGPVVSNELFENIKNGLAVVGALAILMQVVRLAG